MLCRFLYPLLISVPLMAQNTPAWVAKSNENAQVLLKVIARYAPEGAGSLGISGLDEQISIPSLDQPERYRRDFQAAMKELQARLGAESDPLVKQDLQILIDATDQNIRSSALHEQFLLPYGDAGEQIFHGIKGLLDDQIAPERRPAALVRLERYTGSAAGYTPTTTLMEAVYRERAKNPKLVGPAKAEVEKDLQDANAYVTGIGLLFEKYKVKGYEAPYAKLKNQLADHEAFVRREVLPKARTDFRLPPEIYADNLQDVGVDYTPAELKQLAHAEFSKIQTEMSSLAVKVAQERHLSSTDYRDVIRALKREQLKADDVMPLYHQRLADIESIIRREHLLTLPNRPAIIRLATAAETAAQPAPHMQPPRMIGNRGERGQFVLPAGTSGANGKALKYDDFTFAAASWTLTAHEARPGHELQFATMVERGVSLARAVFAFNSTNVEGWGLYSEWFMQPYMPDDGKLISMQLRLLRAARAFLDPELQAGVISPAQAMAVLQKDVVCSEAFATEEVDRFTFRSPGQAVSYFDGYLRLRGIREEAETALGTRFNAGRFHDFVLSQGLLPPKLLRAAVNEDFVRHP